MKTKRNGTTRRGFTLIETAIAIPIVGLSLAALSMTMASGTRVNSAGQKLTHAVFLAQEFHELSIRLPLSDPDLADQGNPLGVDTYDPPNGVDDLDDTMGQVYNPPRDGQGTPITDMAGWSQSVTLTWMDTDSFTPVADGTSNMVYVEVTVSSKGEEVLTTGWVVAERS